MFPLLLLAFAPADSACLIQSGSAGPVRLGMTVAQARQALHQYTISTTEDSEHLAIIRVTRGAARIMDLYPDQDNPNRQRAAIELIRVYDPACATAGGIHPGSSLEDVEHQYGKIKRIVRTGTEPPEEAQFEKSPAWITVQPDNAGVYTSGKRCTQSFKPSARVASLWIAKPPVNKIPEDEHFCDSH